MKRNAKPKSIGQLSILVGLCLSLLLFSSSAMGQSKASSEPDEHGCSSAKAQIWCALEERCVQWWDFTREKRLDNTIDAAMNYCAPPTVLLFLGTGGVDDAGALGFEAELDEHGCIRGMDTWCSGEARCITWSEWWQLVEEKGLGDSLEAYEAHCHAQ